MNRVHDLSGKDYRLLQNNLDKDIVANDSKILVKKDKVIVKLQKVTQARRRNCIQGCRGNHTVPAGQNSHAHVAVALFHLHAERFSFVGAKGGGSRAARERFFLCTYSYLSI